MRQMCFQIHEGAVVVAVPSDISKESIEILCDLLRAQAAVFPSRESKEESHDAGRAALEAGEKD